MKFNIFQFLNDHGYANLPTTEKWTKVGFIDGFSEDKERMDALALAIEEAFVWIQTVPNLPFDQRDWILFPIIRRVSAQLPTDMIRKVGGDTVYKWMSVIKTKDIFPQDSPMWKLMEDIGRLDYTLEEFLTNPMKESQREREKAEGFELEAEMCGRTADYIAERLLDEMQEKAISGSD